MGAKNYSRVKETYKKAVSIAIGISVLAFILFQCFPRQITGIFGSGDELYGDELYFEFAEKYLKIYMFMVCVFGIQPVTINYFTGTGNVRQGIITFIIKARFLSHSFAFDSATISGTDRCSLCWSHSRFHGLPSVSYHDNLKF